jgi:hypothetical protein
MVPRHRVSNVLAAALSACSLVARRSVRHHPEYLGESELLELYPPSIHADAETILDIRQLVLDQH